MALTVAPLPQACVSFLLVWERDAPKHCDEGPAHGSLPAG